MARKMDADRSGSNLRAAEDRWGTRKTDAELTTEHYNDMHNVKAHPQCPEGWCRKRTGRD